MPQQLFQRMRPSARPWIGWYRTGVRARERHDPQHAAAYLTRAVRLCPPQRSGDLSRILTELARTCLALHDPETARRCIAAAVRAHAGANAGAMLAACAEPDAANAEWCYFYSRQMARYLQHTGRHELSPPEADMLRDLLCDEYRLLQQHAAGANLTEPARKKLLARHKVPFPLPLSPLQ